MVLVGIFVLAPLSRVHQDALVDPTVAANTAMDICSIRAVHQILASGSRHAASNAAAQRSSVLVSAQT